MHRYVSAVRARTGWLIAGVIVALAVLLGLLAYALVAGASPAELLDAFLRTARQTLTAEALRGVAVAAGVAAVGLAARALVGRRA